MLIKITESDDDQFIKIISAMFTDQAINYYTEELYLTRVDNWFDHKWFQFSGKRVFEWEFGKDKIPIGYPVWKGGSDLTLPPFSPNPVIIESCV